MAVETCWHVCDRVPIKRTRRRNFCQVLVPGVNVSPKMLVCSYLTDPVTHVISHAPFFAFTDRHLRAKCVASR